MKRNFEAIGVHMDEKHIEEQTETEFKNEIKTKVREAVFAKLIRMQQTHAKVKDIKYSDIKKPQEYLTCQKLNNNECSLLFNLRCHTVKSFKHNFRILHNNQTQCELCKGDEDSQEHALSCPVITQHVEVQGDIEYADLYASTDKQQRITSLYGEILEVRARLLEEQATGAT